MSEALLTQFTYAGGAIQLKTIDKYVKNNKEREENEISNFHENIFISLCTAFSLL